nr:segregation/condensation protein A [Enterococcus thailandicus]
MAMKHNEERVNHLTEINIKLDIFEGPLDLLLHLIQQMEIDIYDIPIATITEQYMNYIHTMKTMELALAGEYLVMAATLMAIKSKTLLPVQELAIEDDLTWEEDPRDELVMQLLEYRKYKYAAEKLVEKAEERSLYYSKEPTMVEDLAEKELPLKRGQVKKVDLFRAMQAILERKQFSQKVEKTIAPDDTTIEERMSFIKEKLVNSQAGCTFESFFEAPTKAEVVTTFIALLELMKNGQIFAEQAENYDSIMLYPVVGDTTNDKIK